MQVRYIVDGTYRDGGCSNPKRDGNTAGYQDCCSCRIRFSSMWPRNCSAPRPAAHARNLIELPSSAQACRAPEQKWRARRGGRRSGHIHESLWNFCGRIVPPRTVYGSVRFLPTIPPVRAAPREPLSASGGPLRSTAQLSHHHRRLEPAPSTPY